MNAQEKQLTTEEFLKSKGLSDKDYMDSGMIDHITNLMNDFANLKTEELQKEIERLKGIE